VGRRFDPDGAYDKKKDTLAGVFLCLSLVLANAQQVNNENEGAAR